MDRRWRHRSRVWLWNSVDVTIESSVMTSWRHVIHGESWLHCIQLNSISWLTDRLTPWVRGHLIDHSPTGHLRPQTYAGIASDYWVLTLLTKNGGADMTDWQLLGSVNGSWVSYSSWRGHTGRDVTSAWQFAPVTLHRNFVLHVSWHRLLWQPGRTRSSSIIIIIKRTFPHMRTVNHALGLWTTGVVVESPILKIPNRTEKCSFK